MKLLKKFLCMVLALTMITCAFVGCNETKDEPKETEESTAPQTEATTPEETEPEETTAAEEEEDKALSKDKTYSVLFIGNSYTFYNTTVPAEFQKAAESAGYKVTVDSVTQGAYTLQQFADVNDTKGAEVHERFVYNQYDFVVLQEQSHTPMTNPNKFYEGARALVKKIRAIDAEPIFYCTWGRRNDNGDIAKFNLGNNEIMTWNLAASYRKIGEELNAAVAYVGPVFYELYSGTDINVFHTDGSHPSKIGTYIAALTIFSTIFGVSAQEATYNYPGTSTAVCNGLKEFVDDAVFTLPKIPDEYLKKYGLE